MDKVYEIRDGGAEIIVRVNGKSGRLTSNCGVKSKRLTRGDKLFNAAIDGVESLILALACAGVNIEAPEIVEAVGTALEAVGNNYDFN